MRRNVMPTHLELMKGELEAEVRAYGDSIQHDLDGTYEDSHLHTLDESLMT